jgi:hypothetical protein
MQPASRQRIGKQTSAQVQWRRAVASETAGLKNPLLSNAFVNTLDTQQLGKLRFPWAVPRLYKQGGYQFLVSVNELVLRGDSPGVSVTEKSYEIIREVVSWRRSNQWRRRIQGSACEDYACEIEDFVCCIAVKLEVLLKILGVILVVIWVLVSVPRSVARRRLVETESPGACAPVTWNVCKSAIALYCLTNTQNRKNNTQNWLLMFNIILQIIWVK